MGVKDLWQLLEPVGRRVNIETLTNKRLAIGALSEGHSSSAATARLVHRHLL